MTNSSEPYHAVFDNFYVAQNLRPTSERTIRFFQVPEECQYFPYCDDFGPMNMASIHHFNRSLSTELENCSGTEQKLVFNVCDGRRSMTNAIFLVGAYMMLEKEKSLDDIVNSFPWLNHRLVEGYRDATYVPVDFELTITDCWRGLAEGLRLQWIGSSKNSLANRCAVNMQLYEHFDNPLNGDLHVVVPGKIAAFAGPVDIVGGKKFIDKEDHRMFSPEYYAGVFKAIGVTDVVQLNFSSYDAAPIRGQGIKVHQLPFPDCTCPSEDIVDAFLRIVDQAPGLVAVHCRAGLGRTGTLVARYLMRSRGLGARQAMAWLRIMRPGSVIGAQQHYLCALDPTTPGSTPPSAASLSKPRASAPISGKPAGDRPKVASIMMSRAGPAVDAGRSWGSYLFPSWLSSAPLVVEPPLECDRLPPSPRDATPPESVGALLAAQVRMGMVARGVARVLRA